MSNGEQNEPVMDGANDATDDEKLDGLKEQVEQDHGNEGEGAKAEHLRDRAEEALGDSKQG